MFVGTKFNFKLCFLINVKQPLLMDSKLFFLLLLRRKVVTKSFFIILRSLLNERKKVTNSKGKYIKFMSSTKERSNTS